MECHTKTLTFKIHRKSPELITPAEPTPREIKPLSDIDDQEGLRFHVPCISIYEGMPSMQGKDPADVIRQAITKALVFYYPFAGRLREIAARKLVVDCTAEGVLFTEADADVALSEFGDELHPPFPDGVLDGMLYNVPGSDGITDCTLFLFQVTRLKCGGFILGTRFNHAMTDGAGILQFLCAVGELARGTAVPSIPPVWERHLLSARRPPHISFAHREYDVVPNSNSRGGTHTTPPGKMARRSFLFSAANISALRCTLPPHANCSRYELVSACAWRCRTIALSLPPDEEIRFVSMTDIRLRTEPPLPEGYYGNATVSPAAVTTAAELSNNPLAYAVELVRKVKGQATDEYVRSVADAMATRGRPSFTAADTTYMVSDLTNGGFERAELGWGKAVYSGAAIGVADWIPLQLHWYIGFKNKRGEQGIVVSIYLPLDAMDVFGKELEMMMAAAKGPTTNSAL